MDVSEYVCYLPNYEVVVCLTCKYCISSNGSKRHFGRWHKDLLLATRKIITAFCQTLQLRQPQDVPPPPDKTPIEILSVKSGRECQVVGCNYVCSMERTAEEHGRNHGWTKGKPKTWKSQPVQVIPF